MKRIVITGSTRGIGRGMAAAFLARGCQVLISSRSQAHVDQAVAALGVQSSPAHVRGVVCDVTSYRDLQGLFDQAAGAFGGVDIWINNAGIPQSHQPFDTLPPEEIRAVIETNLIGVMMGSQVAVQRMLGQGHGVLFNMEGLGSSGEIRPNMALYGASKRAVRYFTRALEKDYRDCPIKIGFLSPGMVLTSFLTGGKASFDEIPESTRKIFNILADRVETVAPFLVDRILEDPDHGARIAWLTTGKIIWRFLTAPIRQRDVFGGDS